MKVSQNIIKNITQVFFHKVTEKEKYLKNSWLTDIKSYVEGPLACLTRFFVFCFSFCSYRD